MAQWPEFDPWNFPKTCFVLFFWDRISLREKEEKQ